MRKYLSVILPVLLFVSSAEACMKKPSAVVYPSSGITVLVMDTAQSLLSGAQVTIGKKVYKTSYDGRVLIEPEDLSGVTSMSVSCDGYEGVRYSLDGSALAIVAMKPKPGHSRNDGLGGSVTLSSRRGDVMYMKAASEPMADMAGGYAAEMAVAEEAGMTPVGYATAHQAEAGKLTAGEVNDFTKWYIWPVVLDSTHKAFVREWKISPRHRYTAQVISQHGYPVSNCPVSLTDGNGNTLFQAVTDNTGKAELWYQLLGDHVCGKHTDFYLTVYDQKQVAKDWSEGLNSFVVDDACDPKKTVDVMFVFDATGSMGDELQYLQAEMKDVIGRAQEATGGLNIRTGAVVYRDHQDEYLTRMSRLTEDIMATQSFIDMQSAGGGGDYPEAVPEALMAALNSAGWSDSARARIAFLILDAPCHQDSATIALLHEQVLNAAALGVRIVPVVCSGLGESGELLVRSIALATNGTSFFLTDDSGIGYQHLKPTTDSLVVEHLNDMLVRTIVEFSYMPDCTGHWNEEEIEAIEPQFIPDPFRAEDIEYDLSIPQGPEMLYLLDVSGKLIRIYEGSMDEAGEAQLSRLSLQLSTGVYFIKAYYDGMWHTKKILVH